MNDERLDWECRPDWLCVMAGKVTDCGMEKLYEQSKKHRDLKSGEEERK